MTVAEEGEGGRTSKAVDGELADLLGSEREVEPAGVWRCRSSWWHNQVKRRRERAEASELPKSTLTRSSFLSSNSFQSLYRRHRKTPQAIKTTRGLDAGFFCFKSKVV